MAPKLDRVLNLTAFTFLSIILFCLILLTPADAIYQCYITKRLINIFFIAGAYIVTFILAVLIYATRIYTNRSVLTGIPKAWIPVGKEDVGTSVRRLVMDGFTRSSIITYQARPRDIAVADGDRFSNYQSLVVDRERPPWGRIDHPGWSSPASLDLPDLPYRTVVQELPHLIEAKAVSLAPPDPFFTATGGAGDQQPIPDTRVVEVLQRPASMGVREYLQHLASLDIIQPVEIGAEFAMHYERARFSAHELYEEEFREVMRVFAEVLKGMKAPGKQILDEIRDSGGGGEGSSSQDTESVIGPSDEEGETDTVDYHGDMSGSEGASSFRGRSHPSVSSPEHEDSRSRRLLATPRTPSMRSLRRVQSNVSGSSGGSVIRLADHNTQEASGSPLLLKPGVPPAASRGSTEAANRPPRTTRMTVYPAHGPIGMLSSPNREGKARHAGTGWVLASVIDKIWLSFFTVTFPSPLYPSPLYSQSIRRYTEVLHMLSMMVMASTMQSLLKKGASFFNTPSPSSEDASINNINITPDDDDDNDNDNDNDTDTDDGTCSFKIKTAPDSDRLFRKVDPAVDGEECIRDCASCTIRYPSKFDVDMKDKLYGNIGGWATHMLVATGKTDWVRDVADEKGSVMEAVERGGVEPSNGKLKLSASNIPVPDEYHYHEPGKQPTTVLLFPSFTIIDHVTPALTPDLIKYFVNPAATTTTPLTGPRPESTEETVSEASSEAGEGSQQPPHPQQQLETTKKTDIKSLTPLRSRPCPHSAVILLCSQRTRDVRCGQSAPLLRREFERHLRPLGLYRELDDERPGGVGIYFVSHVGGHKYAANVIVYRRRDFSNWYCKPAAAAAAAVDEGEGESSDQEEEEQGKTEEGASQGIWLARVRPEDCENIIRYTVLQGKVVKPGHQLRGGFDREKGLISW